MRRDRICFALVVLVCLLALSGHGEAQESAGTDVKVNSRHGQNSSETAQVGTGWSILANPEEAIEEAIRMALHGKLDTPPDFAVLFASSGSDLDGILKAANRIFGGRTKIYGGSSDSRGVMTNQAYAKATDGRFEQALAEGKRSLGIMTVTSRAITFGVGSAAFADYSTVQEATQAAYRKALESAGRADTEMPQAVLLTPTCRHEEEVLEGLNDVVGNRVPVAGGSSGGPTFSVIVGDHAVEKGVSLAVIFTRLRVASLFEGGYEVHDPSQGVVTKALGHEIVEIDGKPALDVFDKWLDGELERLFKEHKRFDLVRSHMNLHPIYRRYTISDGTTYNLFSHPWPKDKELIGKSVMTGTKIKEGETIHLSHGTWETLANRIANLPRRARNRAKIDPKAEAVLGVGYFCAGVMSMIPDVEKHKLPFLIDHANNNAPLIATFTWGEQGYFPGLGNKHGNLLTNLLIILED